MKRTLAAIAAALMLATPAAAREGETMLEAYCTNLGELAEQIMWMRQGGWTMAQMIAIAGDTHNPRVILREAWLSPQQTDNQTRAEVIADFGMVMYDRCIDGGGEL